MLIRKFRELTIRKEIKSEKKFHDIDNVNSFVLN